tara:strand:- start:103 stop:2259 length:2157 start_codon:yes stop_codon:yes gene_type:complete
MQSEVEKMLSLYNQKRYEQAKIIAEKLLLQDGIDDYYPLLVSARVSRVNADFQSALQNYRLLNKNFPNDVDIQNEIGCIHIQLGQLEEARAHFDQCLLANPENESFLSNQGVALKNLGKLVEAKSCFLKVLSNEPKNHVCLSNLASCLNSLEEFNQALEYSELAASLNPEFAAAHSNMGLAYKGLGCLELAENSFIKAIDLSNSDSNCFVNYGNLLLDQRRVVDAKNLFLNALSINKSAEAFNGLALCRKEEGFYKEAIDLLNKAIKLNPKSVTAMVNLANLLNLIGAPSEADRLYSRALRQEPENFQIRSKKLFNLNYIPDLSRNVILQEARKYNDKLKSNHQFIIKQIPISPKSIDIGFVSGDMNIHPIGFFLNSLLPPLRQKGIRSHIFYNGTLKDNITEEIIENCDSFTFISHINDLEVSKLIADKEISVLIDLSGHTGKNRLPLFSLRPCPIQCSWLGYFATTGIDQIDYFLSDFVLSSGDVQNYFVEKLLNLEKVWLCRGTISVDTEFSEAPCLSNGYITFGSFVNRAKVNKKVLSLWASILDSIPNSRLFFKAKQYSDEFVRKQLLDFFVASGISKERIEFEGPSSLQHYYKSYAKVDIILDTFPFPGGTTSFDALYMGVPLISLNGDSYLSRFGKSILVNGDQSDWVANCERGYKALAIRHSADFKKLASIRKNIRNSISRTSLFDVTAFAEAFTECLIKMIDGEGARRY